MTVDRLPEDWVIEFSPGPFFLGLIFICESVIIFKIIIQNSKKDNKKPVSAV